MIIVMNLMMGTVYYFITHQFNPKDFSKFTYGNFEMSMPKPPASNENDIIIWKYKMHEFKITMDTDQKTYEGIKSYSEYNFHPESKLGEMEIFLQRQGKRILIYGYFKILQDGEVIDKIYIRQYSNSTSRQTIENYISILKSLKYNGADVFDPTELDKIDAQVPNSFMQPDRFFMILMFVPFNLIMIVVLILFNYSCKPPPDIVSLGIIPVIEGPMQISFRQRGKIKNWVGYVILTSQEIRIYTFRRLKYQVSLNSPEFEVSLYKDKYIKIQRPGKNRWIFLIPENIELWRQFIK